MICATGRQCSHPSKWTELNGHGEAINRNVALITPQCAGTSETSCSVKEAGAKGYILYGFMDMKCLERLVVVRGWGRGVGITSNGFRVLFCGEEKVLELDRGAVCATL